jgi:simple sugar transport system permease protein
MKLPEFLSGHVVVLFFGVIVVAAALGVARPEAFLSADNVRSMLLQSSVIGLLSLAVSLTLLTGGIDLSVNAIANLASILAAVFLTATATGSAGLPVLLGIPGALVVGVGVGVMCGLFNGFLVAVLGYSSILATLGTSILFVGVGTVITGGKTLFGVSAFAAIGHAAPLGIPLPALVFFAATIVLAFMLQGRRFGFNVYLYGANEAAARFSGINARRLLLGVYAISGGLAGIAGMINLSEFNAANVDFGSSYVLLAILVSVLAGISPLGGAGKIIGVVFAVLILQFLSTGLNLVFQSSGSNFLKDFAWGITLIVMLAIGQLRYGDLRVLFARRAPDA